MAGAEKRTSSAENASVPRNAEEKKGNNCVCWMLLLSHIVVVG